MLYKIVNNFITLIMTDYNFLITLISSFVSIIASIVALFIAIYPSKKKIKPELILTDNTNEYINIAILNPSSEIRVIKYLELISGKRIGKKHTIFSENLLNCQDDLVFYNEDKTSYEEKIIIEPSKIKIIGMNTTRIIHLLNHIDFSINKNDVFFIRVIDTNGRKTTINTRYKAKFILEKMISKTSSYKHLTVEQWINENTSLFDKIINNDAKVYRIFRYISYSMIPIIIFSYLVILKKYHFIILNINIIMLLVLLILLFILLSYTISKNNSDFMNYPSLDMKELKFYKILKILLLSTLIYFFIN